VLAKSCMFWRAGAILKDCGVCNAALRQQLSGSGVSVTRVDVRRLVSRGFGVSDPIASSARSAGMARNRRVEIHIGPR
jgi:outer membrane protein OmpA-like peptidoglycan-associated protein